MKKYLSSDRYTIYYKTILKIENCEKIVYGDNLLIPTSDFFKFGNKNNMHEPKSGEYFSLYSI